MFYGQPTEADLKVSATEYSDIPASCRAAESVYLRYPRAADISSGQTLHLLEILNFDNDTAINTQYLENPNV